VESVLTAHPAVKEAMVIGIPDEIKGSAMVAFCVTNAPPGLTLADELRQAVGDAMGKPLRPEQVHFVAALPKTRNGKLMRRVARAAYLGDEPGDLTALENPATVAIIQQART
jgi:acetyl-CoA synthetase